MNKKNGLLIYALTIILSLLSVSLDAAAAKSKKSSTKSQKKSEKKAEKETKSKKTVINPTESFYDKMWDKFKVGNKADREEVIKTLRKIIKETPEEFMAYYYLGIMCNEEGQSTQALKYYEVALAGFPKSSDIHIRMAKIYDELNKKDDANLHYVHALGIEPNNPQALSRVGIMELEHKNYAKAVEYLKKARDIQPDNSATLKALGEAWLEQGKYSNAADILEQVLLFDTKDAKVHLLLGKAYEKCGNHDKAAEHIELAGKYGKKDSSIVQEIGYDVARNLAKSGKYEEAISAYKSEVKKNANPAQGFYEMAEIFEKIDDTNNAIKAYKKAYDLDKKMIQGIFRCAELYQDKNDKANAEKMLKILKSKSEYKDQAEDMIESLKLDEKEKTERDLYERINSRSTKDADLEAAYIETYESNKKDSEALEKLYNFYKDRGYYDEAIKWYRKYAKVSAVTDYEKKNVEKELKAKLEQDNYYLFGGKDDDKPSKSKTPSDELMNLAFNGENDRQKEMAKFYEERGKAKEATKYINQMKKLGYLSESEAKTRKERLKE